VTRVVPRTHRHSRARDARTRKSATTGVGRIQRRGGGGDDVVVNDAVDERTQALGV